MQRIIFLILGITIISTSAFAQSDAELTEQALAAAPSRARDDASVIKWSSDHTYTTIKEGTNQVVCYSRADERDRQPFAVQCTNMANLERVAQNRRFRADSTDSDGEKKLVASSAENGTRVKAEYGSFFRSINGPDQASARFHQTIALPGATTESSGFPENRDQGGAFIMAAGTSEAHLMIP